MALQKCRSCGADVDSFAKTCPSCGAYWPGPTLFKINVGAMIFLAVLFGGLLLFALAAR